jgi:3-hydroxyisobutyrate dehydrogenase-like beta-hydroxyacid dehydrogenase
MNIGFIGLGRMGSRIAKNLLKEYGNINVYNRTKEKAKELIELGAKFFDTPKELAKYSNIIFTIVSNSEAVKKVLLGSEGAFHSASKDAYFIDMSTIEPDVSIEIYNIAKQKGFHFLDAPLIGSVDAAEKATLTIIVGGDKEDFEHVLSILQKIGKNIFYVGPAGSGSKLKLINNVLIANTPVIFGEILNIAKKSGLDLQVVLNVLKSGIFGQILTYYENRIVYKNFSTRFSLELMLKDLKYAKKLASTFNCKTAIIDSLVQVYDEAFKKGLSQLDYTSVSTVFE